MKNYIIIVLLFSCVYGSKPYTWTDSPVCYKNISSCSYKFGKQHALDVCKKILYTDANNTSTCKAAYNDSDTTINRNTDLGKLTLFPFYDDLRTIFNVTFTDIKFKILRIYFQLQERYISQTDANCMVTEFHLQETLSSNESFSYTCPWTTTGYGGKELEFHFDYGIEQYETRKRYIFKVPDSDDLKGEKVNFFPYVDYTDLGNVTLHIHPLLDDKTIYKVDFIYIYNNQSRTKSTVNLTATNNSHNFYTSDAGDYYFHIEPISNYCLTNKNVCIIQETPKIRIEPVSSFLIGMVGVSLLIPVFMIIVYMWTKHWPGLLKPKTNLLLVTVPTNNAHDIVAPAFAKYLRETYNINVMLDLNDLPKDSFIWLKDAIHNYATHVVFLRSDDELSSNRVIHQDIYVETIRLLKPQLCPNKINECIVSFPYSSVTTEFSNPDLVHLIRNYNFNFEEQFSKIMKFLIYKKLSLRKSTSSYHELLEAIHAVEVERSVRRNQQNIDVIVHTPDEEDDGYRNKHNEDSDEEQVKVNIDISDCCLLGEQSDQVTDNDEKLSDESDSDIDDLDFLGNA